jgi:hypothetical protein
VILLCGSLENLSKILRDHREKSINPRPYLFQELKLSMLLAYSFRGELLFQFGYGNFRGLVENDEFILFYSNSLFNKLKSKCNLCVDGTFKVVPKPYVQLYTVSFLENHCVFHVVFAVVKNKCQDTYQRIFETISQLNGDLNPITIKTDFEIASINALKL